MSWTARLRSALQRPVRRRPPERAQPRPVQASAPWQDDPEHERRVQDMGREWLADARQITDAATSVWSDRLVERALSDDTFKTELFRFVDVFPMLQEPDHLHSVLLDYFQRPELTLPRGMHLGLRASGLAKRAAGRAITHQIEGMAQSFIAGRDAGDALPRLRARWDAGIAFSVDLLGEACVSQVEADRYVARYLQLIDALADEVANWPAKPELESDPFGAVPRANVSLKVSSLDPRAGSIDVERSIARMHAALLPVLRRAAERDVLINFDSEQASLKELILGLFERCGETVEFPAGLAMQAYLRSAPADVERIIAWSRRSGRRVTVRLVKGAYWDYETIHAQQENWPSPVWATKAQTDACFEDLVGRLVRASPTSVGAGGIRLALGSHNVRSIAAALAHLERASLPASALELQMLYGMAEPLKRVALARGLRLREYMPLGELIPGMAYLVRRLLENTSNQSWLRASFLQGAPDDVLLRRPDAASTAAAVIEPSPLLAGYPELDAGRAFFSEPLRDFSDPAQRSAFGAAIADVRIPRVRRDDPASVGPAIERACRGARSWRAVAPLERARCLVRAAVELRSRRDAIAGLIIRENGKTWREADGDVVEAIEFCEYYARAALRLLQERRLGSLIGELDHQLLEPLGVVAVIPPWNFPLAIPCGMTVAALVMGNAVLLKPAEQTPAIGRALCDVLWRAGVPTDALQCIQGDGESVGAELVHDPRVRMIAFTGSQPVGLDILAAASSVGREQDSIKRVICEMGGKNAIIVDATADLDEAVIGVRDSAFGFQGQKCSACSRVIVLDSVHDAFLQRVIEATRALVIGNPLDPDTDIGPLIDAEAEKKVRSYIELGRREGRLELACDVPAGLAASVGKPFVGPHIFSGIERAHRLANEEIFGPVLSVMRAATFDDALAEANATRAKLTGGVFSRTPSHLARARALYRVGDLYLNRGITGARVGRQPFGGLGLSGIGTQAGGPSYLLQFVEPRTVCENTLRRGFSPGL